MDERGVGEDGEPGDPQQDRGVADEKDRAGRGFSFDWRGIGCGGARETHQVDLEISIAPGTMTISGTKVMKSRTGTARLGRPGAYEWECAAFRTPADLWESLTSRREASRSRIRH